MDNLKVTFSFGHKLQNEQYGGNRYESTDFNAYVDFQLLPDETPAAVYARVKPMLEELRTKMMTDTIKSIKEPSHGVSITPAAPAQSPFSKIKKGII